MDGRRLRSEASRERIVAAMIDLISEGDVTPSAEAVAIRVDERLTSYEAESTIPKSRRREVRSSGLIDSRAATIILQDHLDAHIPLPEEEA